MGSATDGAATFYKRDSYFLQEEQLSFALRENLKRLHLTPKPDNSQITSRPDKI